MTRYKLINSQYENDWPLCTVPVKTYVENVGWEPLPHFRYSSNCSPLEYLLLLFMNNTLSAIHFIFSERIENYVGSFSVFTLTKCFGDGIHRLLYIQQNMFFQMTKALNKYSLSFSVIMQRLRKAFSDLFVYHINIIL